MSTPISDDFMPSMPATTREYKVVVRSAGPAYGGPNRPDRGFPGDALPGAQEPR